MACGHCGCTLRADSQEDHARTRQAIAKRSRLSCAEGSSSIARGAAPSASRLRATSSWPPPSRLAASGAIESADEPATSRPESCSWVARGERSSSRATAPLTMGAAMEVPAVRP